MFIEVNASNRDGGLRILNDCHNRHSELMSIYLVHFKLCDLGFFSDLHLIKFSLFITLIEKYQNLSN